MLRTYEAILSGNQVDWTKEAPQQDHPLRVHVTVLEPTSDDQARGDKMAQALERLADSGTLAAIDDPVAWQRKQRQDRPLPGRQGGHQG